MSYRLFLVLILMGRSAFAFAYPEFVRLGYFSCTTCHISPGGGSTLNDYGRSFAAEKLSTWSNPDEERAFHGLIKSPPESLILGGNFRQIQTFVETKDRQSGRWIMMQRDLDACLKIGPTQHCATAGISQRAEESASGHTEYGLRKFFSRFDIGDSMIVRIGRFFPRYGLMIANHTSSIRRGLGFEANRETDQIEYTYLSEHFEATLARDLGRVVPFSGESKEDIKSFRRGWTSTFALAISNQTRSGFSYRRLEAEQNTTDTAGLFAATGLGESTFLLAEIDQQSVTAKTRRDGVDKIQRTLVSHLRIGQEWYRGLVPYLQHESSIKDLSEKSSRTDTYGLGLQWFPRPHLEIDGFWGHILQRRDFAYATAGYLQFHYYL